MRSLLPFSVAVLLAAAPAAAQERAEVAVPGGWTTAFEKHEGRTELRQWVPAGQDAKGWTDLLSVQALRGLAGIGPAGYVERLRKLAERGCEGAMARDMPLGSAARPAAGVFIACAKDRRTGRGEIALYRVLGGRVDLHVVRRSRRVPAFAPDRPPADETLLKEWQAVLDTAVLCPTAGPCAPAPPTR
jgi:hypothetical protein